MPKADIEQNPSVSDDARPLGDNGWLGLQVDPRTPDRRLLAVQTRLCGRTGYLHGGCSLAAATTAMEQAAGRPLVWATAQYLSRASVGEVVAYDTTIVSAGKLLSQVQATSRVGDRTLANYVGAFGQRNGAYGQVWPQRPDAPGPAGC